VDRTRPFGDVDCERREDPNPAGEDHLVDPSGLGGAYGHRSTDGFGAALEHERVRPNGDLYLVDRNRSTDEVRVDRQRLLEALRQAQSDNPDQAVVIAGDRSVRYEEVLQVLDLLQRSNVKRVGLLAKPAP
jgi:hypothetical protein